VVAGMEKHKTPKGEFKILKKIYKPDWYPDPEKKWVQDVTEVVEYIEKNGTNRIPNDHYLNPLGLWKLTFRKFYHIHGDGDGALGRGKRYVSKGCVRMRNSDINHLANFVDVETPVYIT
jgi:lipoprotein-anchoring transpeptidase ErfK/SrfK